MVTGKHGFAAWERSLHWLINAGLIIKVAVANSASLPFAHYTKSNLSRLYIHDIGLLDAMLDIPRQALLDQDYGIAKGFFAENFARHIELHSPAIAIKFQLINYFGMKNVASSIYHCTSRTGPLDYRSNLYRR